MDELVKALMGAEDVNKGLLLTIVVMAIAIVFLWRRMNEERKIDREDRAKANEQQAASLDRLGAVVSKMADMISDMRAVVSACTRRGR